MSSILNRLVILTTADRLPDESFDILALTLPAMAMLKAKGRSFLVLEDLYPHIQVYKDTNDIGERVTTWLQSCDNLCAQYINISRAFSSTGFWILHRLSDLNYIHQIIDILDARYQHIELWTASPVSGLPSPKVDFSSLNMPSFGIGLEHVLRFMRAGLPRLVITPSNPLHEEKRTQQVGGEPWWSLLKRLPDIVIRRSVSVCNKLTSILHKKVGTVWVVQQGYDVDVLDHSHPEWEFTRIRNDEIAIANQVTPSATIAELDQQILEVTDKFFVEYFPRYKVWLGDWCEQYYRQIVLKLNHYEKELEGRMKASRPNALLYSIGSEDALEEVLCRVANRLSIPAFFFKHGGIAEYFLLPSILDPYLEHNAILQRTQFIHSEVEYISYSHLPSVNAVVSGPLSRAKLHYRPSQQNKILYSVGPPAHYSLKELRKMVSDHERFMFMDDLLQICAEQKLDLSVKVHPAEWRVAWECIHILNDAISDSRNKAHIIAGGAIERIFNQFDLLVLDMISTRVLSMAIGLDIPIVLYLPEGSPVNTKYFSDLEDRVYIVRNRRDLVDILSVYQQKGLPSKYNRAFVEKYLGYFNPESAIQIVSDQVFNIEREEVC